MPLTPVILYGENIFSHTVVKGVIFRLSIGFDEAVVMIFFLVIAITGQLRQVALPVKVFPLIAIFLYVRLPWQGFLPDAQWEHGGGR